MEKEIIEGWVKIYESYDQMLSNLLEARLKDESIEYQIMNRGDIGYTMEIGNNVLGRAATGLPLKFFVKPEDIEKAQEIINEDRSAMLDNPDLDFNNIGS